MWEVFHENSKIGRFTSSGMPDDVIAEWMKIFTETLDYSQQPIFKLPEDLDLPDVSLCDALQNRVSTREFGAQDISYNQLGTLLKFSYGVSRDHSQTGSTRAFRPCPSGGGLFPLDVFFYANRIENLERGIYHYNPLKNCVEQLAKKNYSHVWPGVFVQPEFGDASMVTFITAQFERSLFKYQNRGYRFVLLEAGHLAQNLNLLATALGLGSVNIGGFFDREVDRLLGLDGLTISAVYSVSIGHPDRQM